MDIWDLIFDAADDLRPNSELIADIQANFSSEDIRTANLINEGEAPEFDLVLQYVTAISNRRFRGNFNNPMNLEFLSFLLGQGFDVNKKYPGKLMYNLRGYHFDFIKNKDTSLLEFAAMLYREFGQMEHSMEPDENGHINGFKRMLDLIQAASESDDVLELPDIPGAFGEQTRGILGFGYSDSIPSITVATLRDICLFAESSGSGNLSAIPAGDFSFNTNEQETVLEHVTIFLGAMLEEHDCEVEIPLEVSDPVTALTSFSAISSDIWEKVSSWMSEEIGSAFMAQRPGYFMLGNGPLVYTTLASGELSDSPNPNPEFINGSTQEQNPHIWGVSGQRLLSSSHGDLVPVPAELFQEYEKLFLIVQYD